MDRNYLYPFICFILYISPYLIKIASSTGANEVAINFGYSVFAIPFFFMRSRDKDNKEGKIDKKGMILILLIGLFEAIYYICGTIGFIYETPIIVNIIAELRVFMLILLSAIFKTDKLNIKKVLAMMLGITSVILLAM